ncbi:transporter substrate-binding domain-containing protein [Ornithinimicrobium sp. Y1847]|uniref:transporter substrate-binding domain-containing protein n=1 Tax=unclassified Ornithinimicrobium TaxID=2615080 RepID=UPI003B67D589
MTAWSTRTAFIGLAATAGLVLSGCGGGDGKLISDGELVVAMSGEYQPFSYFEGNTLTGFDYDIGVAVAEEMGLTAKGETAAFSSLIGGVQANRYDVIIGSMTPTAERAEAVTFTNSYYTDGAQAFVQAGSDCSDVTELDSPTIGVATGTTYADWLDENGGDWVGDVRSFDSDVVALRDLETGRMDAVITGYMTGLYQIEEAGLDLVACGDPLFTESPAFAVGKDNEELRDDLNEALQTIIDNGTYDELSQKYFGEDLSDGAGQAPDLDG